VSGPDKLTEMSKNKNRNIAWFIIAAVLVAVAIILVLNKGNTTLSADSKDFAVEDTASIYKIKLSDKLGNSTVLERKGDGYWMVNNKWKADRRQVDLLLKTMRLVEVKNPVPLKARNDVIARMASSAVEVVLSDKDGDEIKTYYVAGPTPDEEGTLMLIKGAPEPVVTHIPGFVGYLTPRYPAKPQDWRSTEIFALNPTTITQVSISYTGDPTASFALDVKGDDFILSDPRGKRETMKVPPLHAKQYLSKFREVYWEIFAPLDQNKKDSVLASQYAAVIKVKTTKGDVPSLTLYNKFADVHTKGVGPNNIDEDKLYGYIGDAKNELLLIQINQLKDILVSYDMIVETIYENHTTH
jgi:hypothetical protein